MTPTTAALITALVLLGAVAAGAQHPDISGRWALNQGQSDNPRDMMQGRDSAGGGGGGGGSARHGGWGGGGGGGGMHGGHHGGYGGGQGSYGGGPGGMSEEQRARMHQTMELVLNAPASLAVVQSDSTVTLDADGDTLVLPSNGHKVRREATVEGEGAVDIKGHWIGNDFVVERKVSGGGKVTEDYLREPQGKQLFVIVSFQDPRGRDLMFRRIYDPAE